MPFFQIPRLELNTQEQPVVFSTSFKRLDGSAPPPVDTTTPASRTQAQNGQWAHPLGTADAAWYTSGNRQVTVETLLSDAAVRRLPRRSVSPQWSPLSKRKHRAWLEWRCVDPILRRPQVGRRVAGGVDGGDNENGLVYEFCAPSTFRHTCMHFMCVYLSWSSEREKCELRFKHSKKSS